MTKVNLSEAARMVPVSRSTFNRHLKSGKVSKLLDDNGKPCVDVSELNRVYGDLSHETGPKSIPMKQNGISQDSAEISHENIRLKAELEATQKLLEKTEQSESKWQKEAEDWKRQAQSLLTDQRPQTEMPLESAQKPVEGPQYQIGWWDRFLGRKALREA